MHKEIFNKCIPLLIFFVLALSSITLSNAIELNLNNQINDYSIGKRVDNINKLKSLVQSMSEKDRLESNSKKEIILSFSQDGYLRSLRTHNGQHLYFESNNSSSPDMLALDFFSKYGGAFGLDNRNVYLSKTKITDVDECTYVRFKQMYNNLPVFASDVIVQLNKEGGIEYVLSDIMTDTIDLDLNVVSLAPLVSSEEAKAFACFFIDSGYPMDNLSYSEPSLEVYCPDVIAEKGLVALVWKIIVSSKNSSDICEMVLVNACNGDVVLNYPLVMNVLDRQIFDSNNIEWDNPGVLVRSEGDPASGQNEVDVVYDLMGDTYNFYSTNHGRDSIDNNGMTLIAHVNYCNQSYNQCPMQNAYWSHGTEQIYFGSGYESADDVVAHELTHGVTSYESDLVYKNQSGAINESFSDIWGEFVDLSNSFGTDTSAVRWDLGEDLPIGAIRDMQYPTLHNDPDRMGSDQWKTGDSDYGGVHSNCGVGNKLAYLLTDGDTFNGYSVTGMGISKVADLFYEVQTNLLGSGADYGDLHESLTQAANNLNWSTSEKANLENACRAVDISHGIINVITDNLIINQFGLVEVEVVAPDADDYYVRVWDDDGFTYPEWEWSYYSSSVVSLDLAEKRVFSFSVKPEDTSEAFEFWLYKELIPGVFTIAHRVQVTLSAQQPDNTPPSVTSHYSGSSKNTNIYVAFSEDMNDSTLSSSNISVHGDSSGYHSCSYSFNHSSYELTIDPVYDFSYSEKVTVTIGAGVQDLAGNGISSQYQFGFTIQDPPITPPTSISATANSNYTSIEPYQTITISGTAYYNTSDAVDGTATIDTGDNIYTAAVINGSYSRPVTGPSSSRYVSVSVTDGSLSGYDSVYITVNSDGGTNSYDLSTHVVYDVEDLGGGYCSYWYKDAYRTTDDAVDGLFVVSNANLSSDLSFKLKFYYPDGSQYGSDLEDLNAFSRDWEWGWWYWGYLIEGNSMAYNPGKYKVRFYVDNDRKSTKYYVVAWDFTEHYMCKDYDGNWQPINQTNIFSPDDTRVVALHHFEYRAQGLDVKTDYYAPDGSLYSSSEHSFVDDLGPHEWYGWSRHANWLWINGYSTQYMCGDWTVIFSVKNPVGGYWEQEYTDAFRIEEDTVPSVDSITASPSSPIETQDVTVNISASDNNHLDKLTLHWNDGSSHSYTWSSINSGSTSKAYNIGSFSAGQSVEYWTEVWDESGNRAESAHKTVVVSQEIVSDPDKPAGEISLKVGESAVYTTGGSSTNLGHSVEYQFDWGDSTTSGFGGASISSSWSTEGYYNVKARARCQVHTSRVSDWSNSHLVIVDSTLPDLQIITNNGDNFTSYLPQVDLEGLASDSGISSGLDSVSISTGDNNDGTANNWKFTIDLNIGDNLITIYATDRSGNSISQEINIFYSSGLSGSGTEQSPYLIQDFDDFMLFCRDSSYWAADVYTRLDCDLDLDPALDGRQTFTHAPIAYDIDDFNGLDYDGTPYSGNFNGNGYTISNLAISSGVFATHYLGLFGKLEGVNASIVNLEITCNVNGSEGSSFIGSICGENEGEVIDCYSSGFVSGSLYVGGLCGGNQGEISKCFSTCSLIGSQFGGSLGGLVGSNHDGGTISDCYSTGSVYGNYGSSNIGGLVGYNPDGNINYCYSCSSVDGDGSANLGGLCGYKEAGAIDNCFWDTESSGINISDGGTGLKTDIMQTQSTYLSAGWNFTSIWKMDDYPVFQWQRIPSNIYVDDDSPNDPGSGTQVDPFRCIQYAIDYAIGDDRIIIAQGTYNENLVVIDKNVTIAGTDSSDPTIVALTIVDGQYNGTVINFENANCIVEGISIVNGLAQYGGGLNIFNSTIEIKSSQVHGNYTDVLNSWYDETGFGGGMYIDNSEVSIIDSEIYSNSTGGDLDPWDSITCYTGSGGGIYSINSDIVISGSVVCNNSTADGGDGYPGGSSGYGGGVYASGGTLTITGSEFYGNRTGNGGSGVDLLENGGDAGSGGAIYSSSTVFIQNCLFRDNKTGNGGYGQEGWDDWRPYGGDGGNGGAIRSSGIIENCTFINNSTGVGGDGYYDGSNGSGDAVCGGATLKNCIVWGDDLVGVLGVSYSCVQGGFTGIGNISDDPLFADPASNDFHLKSLGGHWNTSSETWILDDITSPCIDAGDPLCNEWNNELCPNGQRTNIGAYGGTMKASRSNSNFSTCVDYNDDGSIDLLDFAILAEQWLNLDCILPDFCVGVDLDHSGEVNLVDLESLSEYWLYVEYVNVFDQSFETDPGWSMQGQWEFGQPSGAGGAYGNPDPVNGSTGANVCGVNLNGDYSVVQGGPYYLTTGPIDCTGYYNVKLQFDRWLNSDDSSYVACKIEVSNDGINWYQIWQNGNSPTTDSEWVSVGYNISDFADNQSSVFIRWSYEILSSRANSYSGWNIDDVQLWGNDFSLPDFDLSVEPDGWTTDGQWSYGVPSGNGGASYGNPDPVSGYVGGNVYGVNLDGDYSIIPDGPHYLTTSPIDCTGYSNVGIRFARWLNTDEPGFVASSIEASNNGTDWTVIWQHSLSSGIIDNEWKIVEYDLSGVADNQPEVYIRWGYEIINSHAYPFSGWNIDEIEFFGNK